MKRGIELMVGVRLIKHRLRGLALLELALVLEFESVLGSPGLHLSFRALVGLVLGLELVLVLVLPGLHSSFRALMDSTAPASAA